MKRFMTWSVFVAAAVLVVPTVSADVKTKEKTTFAFEGVLGGVVRIFGGSAARNGIETTTAVKGNRLLSIGNVTGRLVDLAEQKSYDLDVRRKEYRVMTFAEMRAQFEKAKEEARKQAEKATPEEKQQMQDSGKQLEFDVKVGETGQKKSIAGYDTREVVLTITGREKGKTLDESGGFVLTSTLWLAPRIAALDELAQFELKVAKAVYGEEFVADMQQMAGVMATYPAFGEMAKRMQTEGRKLQGTALSTTTVFEGVKSAEAMKAAADQQASSSSGGGLTGRFARRVMGNREPQQRTKVLTTTHDLLSVDASATDADVAMPAGYKEKK